jgi:hypothetical protein
MTLFRYCGLLIAFAQRVVVLPKCRKFKTIRTSSAPKIGEATQWPTRIFGIG